MDFKLFFLFVVVITLAYASSTGKKRVTAKGVTPTTLSSNTQPARGDHVINNSVLRVYKDIIDQFLRDHLKIGFNEIVKGLRRYPESSSIYKDRENPLADDIPDNIQKKMVAFFPPGYPYIDTNAAEYGRLIQSLRQSATSHMIELYKAANANRAMGTIQYTRAIKDNIFKLNAKPVYVDTMAADYWVNKAVSSDIREKARRKAMYEKSLIAVRVMFQNLYDKLANWVRDIRHAGY